MNAEQFQRVESLFHELEFLDDEAREKRLATVDEDAAVIAEVRSLLKAAAVADDEAPTKAFMGSVQAAAGDFEDFADVEDGRIGPYRLVQRLGDGGMGVVYLAEQEAPIQRRVALKVLRLGMDTREVLGRFESERQSLARMSHPNIATVLDAGTTSKGRPYFVMELVRGEPLTTYCDRRSLSLRARVELFSQVCDAVQHAHQKGVIHRDLKPSNILVAEHDGAPVPKVIDFGIAKAIDESARREGVHTAEGQLIGTPEYMSPEQLGAADAGIDVRTDVYSLGVVLYELATGALPFPKLELTGAGIENAIRTVRETEPPRPSARLTTERRADRIAEKRRTSLHGLTRELRTDLDWIIMKAMEKSRDRRYDSASALAADLRRFLANEPVLAGPPSRTYRMKKFVRKHRTAVSVATIIMIVVLAGLATTSWQAIRATRAEHAAALAANQERSARRDAETALEQARTAQAIAEAEQARATAISGFLATVLRSPTPDVARGRELTVREVLDAASSRVDETLADRPEVRGAVRRVIGESYWALGDFTTAATLLQSSLEDFRQSNAEDRIEASHALVTLGLILLEGGRPADAIPLFQRGREELLKALGPDHADVIAATHNLGYGLASVRRSDEAEPLLREAAQARRWLLGDAHRDTIHTLVLHAQCLTQLGRMAEAAEQAAIAMEGAEAGLEPDDPKWVQAHRISGWIAQSQGRLDDAERHYTEAVSYAERVQGEDHPDTLWMQNQLAWFLMSRGKLDGAFALADHVFTTLRDQVGMDNRRTLDALNTLATIEGNRGRVDRAEELHELCLEGNRRLFGERSLEAAASLNNLSGLFWVTDPARARLGYEEVLAIRTEQLGPDHFETISARYNVALTTASLDQFEEASELFRRVIADRSRVLGSDHPQTMKARTELGSALCALGRWDEAVETLSDAVPAIIEAFGEFSTESRAVMLTYGVALRGASRLQESIAWLERNLECSQASLSEGHRWLVSSRVQLAATCALLGDTERAWALLSPVAHRLEAEHPLREDAATALLRDAFAPLAAAQGDDSSVGSIQRWLAAESVHNVAESR